ncbi:hypothetical protein [Rhizobium sp. H4]|uniref:hypothetical protein n=1 Tax=Rhizobium sp. H4 TaxID=2035449 RepID=UPI001145011D|nr:hypothetical protein [Rhizobium sp. H4]
MLIGHYRFAPLSDFQVTCAYAGCADYISLAKGSVIMVDIGGTKHEMFLAGLSDPSVYNPPRTASSGADLPVDRRVDIRWFRLDFAGRHPLLGEIEVGLAAGPHAKNRSRGQVNSMSGANYSAANLYKPTAVQPSGAFFPALNENEFYFQIYSHLLDEIFVSDKPVRNQAIIDRMPPLDSEYSFKEPVTFRPLSKPMCRTSISLNAESEWQPFAISSFQLTPSRKQAITARSLWSRP